MTWTSTPILNAIASHGGCVTDDVLIQVTGLEPIQVERAILKLRKHEFVTRDADGCNHLTKAGKAAHQAGLEITSGPRRGRIQTGHRSVPGGLRQRAWTYLRRGQKVTLDDVLLIVVEGQEKDPRSNLLKYFTALAKAGYLLRLPARDVPDALTSNGAIRWLLVSDTGPMAPVWRPQRHAVRDPNLERDISTARVLEAIPARRMEVCHG